MATAVTGYVHNKQTPRNRLEEKKIPRVSSTRNSALSSATTSYRLSEFSLPLIMTSQGRFFLLSAGMSGRHSLWPFQCWIKSIGLLLGPGTFPGEPKTIYSGKRNRFRDLASLTHYAVEVLGKRRT